MCASNCVQKAKFVDQKCMQAFIEHQQQSMQKFMEEASLKQTEQETVNDSNISVVENNERTVDPTETNWYYIVFVDFNVKI